MFPFAYIEILAVCVGWSFFVGDLLFFLRFGLALFTAAALARVPVTAVLRATRQALTQFTPLFRVLFFRVINFGFYDVRVVKLL